MKTTKLFLIAATAIMLIMTACSGAFVDPGTQGSNGLGGGGGGGSGDFGGGGNPLCSGYQSDYDTAKSIVENYEWLVESNQRTYDQLKNSGASYAILSSALNGLARDKAELRDAQSELEDIQWKAAKAGCSVY